MLKQEYKRNDTTAETVYKNKENIKELSSTSLTATDLKPIEDNITNIETELAKTKTNLSSTNTLAQDNKLDIDNIKLRVNSLEHKGVYKGTYADLSSAQLAIPNPLNGDYILIGSTAPFTEFIYNEPNTLWEQAGSSGGTIDTSLLATKQELTQKLDKTITAPGEQLVLGYGMDGNSNTITMSAFKTALGLPTRKDITATYATRVWNTNDAGKKVWITYVIGSNNIIKVGFISEGDDTKFSNGGAVVDLGIAFTDDTQQVRLFWSTEHVSNVGYITIINVPRIDIKETEYNITKFEIEE